MASAPLAFKDHGKDVSDLLTKGFPSSDRYDLKVELKSTENQVTFTPSLTKTEELVAGQLQVKNRVNSYLTEVTTTTDLARQVKVELAFGETSGVKPSLELSTSVDNFLQYLKFKPSFEYRHERVRALTSVLFPLSTQKPVFNANFVAGLGSGFTAGVDAEVNHSFVLTNVGGLVGYAQPTLATNVFVKRKKDKGTDATLFGLNFYHILNNWKNLVVGGEVLYTSSETSSQSLALAASYKPDSTSIAKTRLTNEGLLGLSYTQKFDGPLTATFGLDLHLINLSSPNALRYNLKLNLG